MSLKEQMGELWSQDRLSLLEIERILGKAQADFPRLPFVPPFVMEEVLEAGFRKVSKLSKEDAKKKAKEFDAYFREVFDWAFKNLGESEYYKPSQKKNALEIQSSKEQETQP